MLPVAADLLRPIAKMQKDDDNAGNMRKPMTEADVCKRIQVILNSERKGGEDFDDTMLMRGGEQENGMENECIARIGDFKEKDLEHVSNHLERLRNEKYNP